ncbi:MAG: tetratricopeptide repeat protein [Myxococcaceae bacterium]|nr:tetratricopeptide repeat protein [Myxococcaceae bacterium]
MTPDERTEAEARADRALRRGELSTALELFTAIAAAYPGDAVVQQKLKRIRENLQPMELSHAKTRVPLEQAPPPTNSIQSAEALAARGDYAGAIALYRKALEKRPDSDLIRERLAELFQIAQSMAPRASPIPPPARAAPKPAAQAPVSTARMLSDLLDQISRRRRTLPPRG